MGGWVLTPTFYHMLSFTLRCQRRLSQHMFLACLSNIWPDDDNLTIQQQQVWRGGSSQEPSPPQPSSFSSHTSGSLFLLSFSLSSLYFWHLPHLLSQIQVKKIWALPFTDICWLSCNLQEANFDAIPVTFLGCISRFTFWQLQRPSQWIPIFSKKDITASNLFLLVIFLIWIVVGHLGLEYHLNRVPFPNAILHLKPKLSEKDGYRIMYKSYGWDVRLCLCLSFCLCLSSKSSSSSSLVDGAW